MRPTELLLSALASCSAMDVVNILRKQRQPLEKLSIRIDGERADAVPAPFVKIELKFFAEGAVDDHKLQRAVQLAVEKYCSVRVTLDPKVEITWTAKLGKPGAPGGYVGPRSTPTVDGDFLYAVGQWGEMVCLETATGKEHWRKDFTKDFGGVRPGWGFAESPLVDGDKVIIDLTKRKLDVEVNDAELARRKTSWKHPAPKYQRGWLARYTRMVTNASNGAVLE